MKNHHVNVFFSEEDEGYIADIPVLFDIRRDTRRGFARGAQSKRCMGGIGAQLGQIDPRASILLPDLPKMIRERGARSECRGDAPVLA